MRIMLSSEHRYPMDAGVSSGRHPREFSSGSGYHLHDLLAKGLAESGHEVLYLLPTEPAQSLPEGVRRIAAPQAGVDIHHNVGVHGGDFVKFMNSVGVPSVATCHLDRHARPGTDWIADRLRIHVSKALAQSHNSTRYVHNGLDPGHYVYSATKQDYFLFMSPVERAWQKGLDTAFELSRRTGNRLVVAGTASDYSLIRKMERACEEAGADYVGDVRGPEKADLFAGAKAFLFPTRMNEAFGLVMVEALLSGTPVICSDRGACPEVIGPSVGFVCKEWEDYVAAVGRLSEIRPENCLNFAVERYHYRRMVRGYVNEYEAEIGVGTNPAGSELCITAS